MGTFEAELAPTPTEGHVPGDGDRASGGQPGSNMLACLFTLALDESRMLGRVAIKTAILATALLLLIPNQYEATTRLLPPDNNSTLALAGVAAKLGIGSAAAASAAGALKSGSIFLPMLQSRTVQDRIINRFDLRRVYRVRYYQDARLRLAGRTSISEDRQTGVITMTVNDRDARRAAGMAQAYVEELNRVAADLNTSDAHRERLFLEGRLKAIKVDLDQAAKQLGEFSSNNVALDIKEQGKAMVEGVAMLQGQLIAAESELKGLEQMYGDENSRVQSVRARIAELRRQAAKLGGNGEGQIYPGLRKLPQLGVQYAEYYRRVLLEETVYNLLNQQYELAKIQEAKELPTIRVLDPAEVPEKKSFPQRSILILASTMLSVFLTPLFLYGSRAWARVDVQNPWKVIVARVKITLTRTAGRLRFSRRG
jgi:capsule polysaccharide export protein KpsE/RkpR